ncbi:RHS repeat domain-containing protein [Alistipes indistinctus]|uniref:RHS repeat domain-containing protein n=1 Tax=Alistipes indistinctus TaxID=626932 RepID=UPI003F0D859E
MKAKYAYSADGVKLSVSDGANGYDYLGSLIYVRTNGSLSLDRALFDGGALRPNGAVDYFVKDHLGSVRVIVDQAGTVRERNDYYPFGERCPESTYAVSSVNRYKFNGKEEQTVGDLGMLDYGARMYQAGIGRWFTQDPLAEKDYSVSPYAYCRNNPIRFVDPDGMIIVEADLREWRRLSAEIQSKQALLSQRLEKLTLKGAKQDRINWLSERIAGIGATLETMNVIENSSPKHALNTVTENEGYLSFDAESETIMINYTNTANFVHEVTHAGQFETGDVAFNLSGEGIAQDIYDEVNAYKAQYLYDPFSLPSSIKSLMDINPAWVQGLQDAAGVYIYDYNKGSKTGLYPVNINSTKSALIKAYPRAIHELRGFDDNVPFKKMYNDIYIKK